MYSSAAWLGLALPGGEESAPRAAWAVPARGERALVRLRLAPPPPHAAHPHPLTAYIRSLAGDYLSASIDCLKNKSNYNYIFIVIRGHVNNFFVFIIKCFFIIKSSVVVE